MCAFGCVEAGVCLVAAEDAAAQHEVTFRQWRENPAAFGIGDRYPVDEVFAEAKNAWQRAHPSTLAFFLPSGSSEFICANCSMHGRSSSWLLVAK